MIGLLALATVPVMALAGLLLGLGAGLASGSSGREKGVTLMLAIGGGLFAGLVAGVFNYQLIKRQEAVARHGWNLVPVVVAAVDIEPRTVITFDLVSQRSIPEQFVTAEMVKPDSASYIVNVPSAAKLYAGDVLLWGFFCAPAGAAPAP